MTTAIRSERLLALIPARVGSKRLPNKNNQRIGDRTLVQIAYDTAVASGAFDTIVVSSERWHDVDAIWHVRPPELADGDLRTLVLEVLRNLANPRDAVMLLQPTSPFRTAEDIHACIALWRETGGDSVISVTECPDELAFQVRFAKRLEALPNVVVPNGAVYLITTDALASGLTWYNGNAYAYHMPKDRSLDIDTEQDLEIARHLWRGNHGYS